MRTTAYPGAVLALLLGLFSTLPARTAEPDKLEPKAEKKKDDDAGKKAPASLTDKSLLEMLQKLGYEPTIRGENKSLYELVIKNDGFQAVVTVSLSKSQTRLWFSSHSRKLVDPDAIPRGVLLKLMALNDEISPSHFILDDKTRQVYLQFSVPNQGIRSADLNVWLEALAADVKRTWPYWKYSVLQPPRAVVDGPAASKEREKFLGTWAVHSFEENGTTKSADKFKGYTYAFAGTACDHGDKTKTRFLFALDPEKTPAHIDLRIDLGSTDLGIYKLEGDTLTLCIKPGKDGPRPDKFESPEGSGTYVLTLKRQKP